MRKTISIALLSTCLALSVFAQQKQIIVDASRDLGAFGLLVGTNCGPIGKQSNEDYTQFYKDLGFKAIRTHDYYGPCDWYTIFPDWNKNANDPASYNFITTDNVIKKIIDEGFKVLFRIGPSWRDDVRKYHTDPPGTIRDNQGNVTHVADLADFIKFANVCKHIVMHYNAGWANGFQYNIKKWEIWNEPSLRNHFWSGTPQQFYQMFEYVARKLKNYDSSLIIGGPGLAGPMSKAYHEDLIAYCALNNVPLDFFSWHSYGGIGLNSPVDIENKTTFLRGVLDSNGYTDTLLICDEWNAGLDAANFAHSGRGAAFYACVLTAFVKNNIPECYQYRADDHSSSGLVGRDGQLRIAAYSLKAWKMLTESTIRLQTTNTNTHRLETKRTNSLEFTALASRSQDKKTLWVLLSNFLNETKQISLLINNVTVQAENGWLMTRQVINDVLKLEEIESKNIGTGTSLSLSFNMQPESVQLLKFTPEQSSGNGDADGDKKGCFIATACYGTPMAAEVRILCTLRDKYLLTNPVGKTFVSFYYRQSPKAADFIRDKEYLKAIIREFLKPIVWIIASIV